MRSDWLKKFMKVLSSFNLDRFTTHSHRQETTSKDARAGYVQAATKAGFHRTTASLPPTPMATG